MVQLFAKDSCVLLVDADPSSSKKALEVLLDAEYRVVMVGRGDEALSTIQHKKRKVDLVLMSPGLPDICAFKLVKMLVSEYDLPVIMICDCDVATILRSIENGAIFCLQKPLCMEQAETFWHYTSGNITDAEAGCWIEAMPGKCLQESANGVSSESPEDLNATVFQPQANPSSGLQEMGLLPTALLGSDLSSALLPSTPQSSPGPVLPADTAQSSIQAPDSFAAEAP